MKRGWAFRRIVRLPLSAAAVHGHSSALPRVACLGRLFLDTRQRLAAAHPEPPKAGADEYLFQLPGEPRVLTRHMSAWVSLTLDELGIRAPPGFAYLGHSLRSGGSSAAEAIGVSRFRGNWLGGWAQAGRTRELHYLDPSVLPTPAAYSLLGWLLAGEYDARPPAWNRSAAAPRDEPGEPEQ